MERPIENLRLSDFEPVPYGLERLYSGVILILAGLTGYGFSVASIIQGNTSVAEVIYTIVGTAALSYGTFHARTTKRLGNFAVTQPYAWIIDVWKRNRIGYTLCLQTHEIVHQPPQITAAIMIGGEPTLGTVTLQHIGQVAVKDSWDIRQTPPEVHLYLSLTYPNSFELVRLHHEDLVRPVVCGYSYTKGGSIQDEIGSLTLRMGLQPGSAVSVPLLLALVYIAYSKPDFQQTLIDLVLQSILLKREVLELREQNEAKIRQVDHVADALEKLLGLDELDLTSTADEKIRITAADVADTMRGCVRIKLPPKRGGSQTL